MEGEGKEFAFKGSLSFVQLSETLLSTTVFVHKSIRGCVHKAGRSGV